MCGIKENRKAKKRLAGEGFKFSGTFKPMKKNLKGVEKSQSKSKCLNQTYKKTFILHGL